jgi:hypothetical protein
MFKELPWTSGGEHVWVDNRDQRFSAGLDVLLEGLKHARNSGADAAHDRPSPPRPPE